MNTEKDPGSGRFAQAGETAAREHRQVQKHAEELEKAGSRPSGRWAQPQKLPKQHQEKPGLESELSPRPRFEAADYKGSGKLEGMKALVTGGDSGIGRAVSVLFAREGADVAIVYLSEHDDARETKKAVEREGRRCKLIPGDVADSNFCREAVESAVEEFGGLDILVNNAAFQEHTVDFEQLTDEQFDLTLKTNLYGYFFMARAAVPHIRQGGSIVMTGSVTGLFGGKDLIDYSMTKGGIHAFARSLAGHLLPRGVRVNVVAPGPVWTPLNPADKPAEAVEGFGSKTPMKRPAQPEEIAPAFVFLAAPACSSYITGEILPIIGGY
jgi:NAD(P)-dependent dehydrogenase (short-subunit alcohol dehydrogenase family)